jgi:DNA-binding transcriptional MocR family regulator
MESAIISDIFSQSFSNRSKRLKASAIRELLKISTQEGIISFAGGTPDPATFPTEEFAKISEKVIKEEYKKSLQYSTTEGDGMLKDAYIDILRKYDNIDWIERDNMLVTTGSQQGLDLIGRIFINNGDDIAVELPTYLGALTAYNVYGPSYHGIELEDDGLNVNQLENLVKELKREGKKLKFLYTITNFHNPAGVTMSLEKRKRVLELAEEYDFFIIEDDPYGLLRFEGEKLPSLYYLNRGQRVILLNTFSKILAPGLRIGIIISNKEVIRKCVVAKQGADLCGPAITQKIAGHFLHENDIEKQLEMIIKLYKEKKDIMLDALDKYLGDVEGVSWTKPQGGLFLWVRLPENIDSGEMFKEAVEKYKVAYILGSAFYFNGEGKNTMRLCFALPPKEIIPEGIKRLAELIKSKL